jgi:hypothetical protein
VVANRSSETFSADEPLAGNRCAKLVEIAQNIQTLPVPPNMNQEEGMEDQSKFISPASDGKTLITLVLAF